MKTIVIGAGASGLVSAIAAANAGSSVTVVVILLMRLWMRISFMATVLLLKKY